MPPRKSGLGKGLGALIPEADEEPGGARGVSEIPLASISPNPHQPRSPIRDQDVVELAASIEEHGIIQPLIVTESAEGYQLIAGERRWRAARLAGLRAVPAVIKEAAPTEMLELALVENIQRSDLSAMEEAYAYNQLAHEFGLTQKEIAKRVGKSREAVSNTLRLLKAAPAVQKALLTGKISEGHARALLALENDEKQEAALSTVMKKGLNVRQTEELARSWVDSPSKKKRRPRVSPETKALENDFRQALGTKVKLTRSGKEGRLVIYFYSKEELEAIFERIVGEA